MSHLADAYWEAMLLAPVGLPEFMEQVAAGAYGEFTKEEITTFLEETERDILANIQLRAGTNPRLAADADALDEETKAMIAELRARYGKR